MILIMRARITGTEVKPGINKTHVGQLANHSSTLSQMISISLSRLSTFPFLQWMHTSYAEHLLKFFVCKRIRRHKKMEKTDKEALCRTEKQSK